MMGVSECSAVGVEAILFARKEALCVGAARRFLCTVGESKYLRVNELMGGGRLLVGKAFF